MAKETISSRENSLRMLEYRYPEWLPCSIAFAPIVWKTYREDLENIVLDHPRLFQDYDPSSVNYYDHMPPVYRQGEYYTDNWGCTWFNSQEGLEGQVVGHPLADWSALSNYHMPDPLISDERELEPKNWEKIKQEIAIMKKQEKLTSGNAERLFDRLYFLRGFDNLMLDFALEPPELDRLIVMLEEYEMILIQRWIELGVDMIGFHTDFGMQTGLMISPKSFRKHIKPMFMHLFQTCRKAGVHVLLSSDGCLVEVVDDLIECGVSVHDPQLRANTLEGIVKAYKGRLPTMVDLDRQGFPFMSPSQIRLQVKGVIDAMYIPEGGLGINAAVYGIDVSLPKIEALLDALEEFCYF
jgi:hypothetical protein